jgi:outer membrane protein assembly factor BamB
MKRLLLLFLLMIVAPLYANVLSQWRGSNRDGIFQEKNLLKEWPAVGPKMLWSFEGIGKGHSSVAVVGNRVYVVGMPDTLGVLYAFDTTGDLLWKKTYGKEWTGNYPGSRSTPTIVDNLLYIESGNGVVTCFERETGKTLWSKDLLETFNAKNIQWGMAESVLIDGNNLICTPGGAEFNVVALNRFTGKTVWTTKGFGDPAAYCSPILANHNGTKLVITMTSQSIIGIDAKTGRTLWRVQQDQSNKIHANSPLYFDGKILCASASAKTDFYGLVLLSLSNDGTQVETVWRNLEYINLMGSFIKDGNYIYGGKSRKKEWYCIDWRDGSFKYIHKGLGSGVIVKADGLYYCYNEAGELALVDANPNEFSIISKFDVPLGTDQHWAHPVIQDGRMYIRHGDALMVCEISEQ